MSGATVSRFLRRCRVLSFVGLTLGLLGVGPVEEGTEVSVIAGGGRYSYPAGWEGMVRAHDLAGGGQVRHCPPGSGFVAEGGLSVRGVEEEEVSPFSGPSGARWTSTVLGARVGAQASWIGFKLGGSALWLDEGTPWIIPGGELWAGYPPVVYGFVAVDGGLYATDGSVTLGLGIQRPSFRLAVDMMTYVGGGAFWPVVNADVAVGRTTWVGLVYRHSSEIESGDGLFLRLTYRVSSSATTTPASVPSAPSSEAPYQSAVRLYAAGDWDGAWTEAYEVLRADAGKWEAWQLIGNCQWAKGDRTGAIASYRASLQLHPDNPQLEAFIEQAPQP